MTVAVGFRCTDGIVLAADREVSTTTAKYDGPKAWIYAYPRTAPKPVLRLGIVGAGDYSFVRYASERIDGSANDWIEQHGEATIDQVHSLVQGAINDIHHNHLYPVGQPHERPTIELLIGIWVTPDLLRLTRTSLTAITKVWDYEAVGGGSDLANFLARRADSGQKDPRERRVPVTSAVFWATQVLMHAKNYVLGCGGSSSDVIVMLASGSAGLVKQPTISEHEQFLRDFESSIQPVLFSGTDPGVADDEFVSRVDALSEKLKALRKQSNIAEHGENVRRDIVIHAATIPSTTVLGAPTVTVAPSEPDPPPPPPPPRSRPR